MSDASTTYPTRNTNFKLLFIITAALFVLAVIAGATLGFVSGNQNAELQTNLDKAVSKVETTTGQLAAARTQTQQARSALVECQDAFGFMFLSAKSLNSATGNQLEALKLTAVDDFGSATAFLHQASDDIKDATSYTEAATDAGACQ